MTRTEAYDAWKAKINEETSENCCIDCAEDKERGLYWIEYNGNVAPFGARVEFKYELLVKICPTCGAEIDGEYSRCTSCQLMINMKCGM